MLLLLRYAPLVIFLFNTDHITIPKRIGHTDPMCDATCIRFFEEVTAIQDIETNILVDAQKNERVFYDKVPTLHQLQEAALGSGSWPTRKTYS